jgi:hypothetical protein
VSGMTLSTSALSGQELIAQLLERSPPGVALTFTAEQLETIEQVFAEASYTSQGQSDDEWQQTEVGEASALTPTALQAAHPSVGDRRRPGRSEYILPTLISLFRRPTDAVDGDLDDDDMRAAQGLAIAVLLSLPFWLLVGIGVGYLLSR